MTTNKVCGKGKCKFTDEFCMSGDCPYDTENVAQRNSQDLERVADTSKTIVVEKEVYEAVLMNSVKVADLEAENMQLRQFCEGFNTLNVAEENQKLKSLLKEWIHYYPIVLYEYEDTLKTKYIIELYDRTREVLR